MNLDIEALSPDFLSSAPTTMHTLEAPTVLRVTLRNHFSTLDFSFFPFKDLVGLVVQPLTLPVLVSYESMNNLKPNWCDSCSSLGQDICL